MNLSSNSVENITDSKKFKNTFYSSEENIIDMDVYHTSDSSNLSHQSKILNISPKLTNIVTDAKIVLQEMKQKPLDKLILGQVNIT